MASITGVPAILRRMDWAESYLGELFELLAEAPKPSMRRRISPEDGAFEWALFNVSVPSDVELMVSDCLRSMDAILDNLSYVIAKFGAHPNELQKPRRPEFPLCESLEKFEKFMKDKLPEVDAEAKALLLEVQPFNHPGPLPHPLPLLRTLSNIDKHRELHVIVSARVGQGLAIEHQGVITQLDPSVVVRTEGPLVDGKVLARAKVDIPTGAKLHIAFGFDYVFEGEAAAEGENVKGEFVQPSMVLALDYIKKELLGKRFGPYFEKKMEERIAAETLGAP